MGSPTGTIFNGSASDFLLAPKMPASFLFCTFDGTIAAWNPNVSVAQGAAPPSTRAITVAKNTDGSSYTGLTSALIGDKRYLYAANFTQGRVDVHDSAFHRVKLDSDNQGGSSSDNTSVNKEGNAHLCKITYRTVLQKLSSLKPSRSVKSMKAESIQTSGGRDVLKANPHHYGARKTISGQSSRMVPVEPHKLPAAGGAHEIGA